MPIVGRPQPPKPPYWAYRARYKLRDCECGGKQDNGDMHTLFVGGKVVFWAVKCRRCGKVVRGETQEDATRKWNGGDIDSKL